METHFASCGALLINFEPRARFYRDNASQFSLSERRPDSHERAHELLASQAWQRSTTPEEKSKVTVLRRRSRVIEPGIFMRILHLRNNFTMKRVDVTLLLMGSMALGVLFAETDWFVAQPGNPFQSASENVEEWSLGATEPRAVTPL